MITLNKEQIKRLHGKLLKATGGLEGIRDEGLLMVSFATIRLWTEINA